jgi:release factor glutamine methyltransferase
MNNSSELHDIDLAQLRSWAIDVLAAAGVPEPEVDTDVLLSTQLGIGRGELAAKFLTESSISSEDAARFRELISRRESREPLQHILGVAWFRSLTLAVGPGVFVPRPETEQLAGMVIEALKVLPDSSPIAVDLGTGSGAIALSIATEVPHAHVFAVEKSTDALPWTTKNFAEYGADNARLIQGDLAGDQLLSAYPEILGQVAVIVSNPPYIPAAATPRDPEVHLFDPHMALYGGEDGLDFIRQISQISLNLGRTGAQLMLEHGENQGQAIRDILSQNGWRNPSTHKDFSGRDRYTIAVSPK